eukprot:gene3560-4436_t
MGIAIHVILDGGDRDATSLAIQTTVLCQYAIRELGTVAFVMDRDTAPIVMSSVLTDAAYLVMKDGTESVYVGYRNYAYPEGVNCDWYPSCLATSTSDTCPFILDTMQEKCLQYAELEQSLPPEAQKWSQYVRSCIQRVLASKLWTNWKNHWTQGLIVYNGLGVLFTKNWYEVTQSFGGVLKTCSLGISETKVYKKSIPSIGINSNENHQLQSSFVDDDDPTISLQLALNSTLAPYSMQLTFIPTSNENSTDVSLLVLSNIMNGPINETLASELMSSTMKTWLIKNPDYEISFNGNNNKLLKTRGINDIPLKENSELIYILIIEINKPEDLNFEWVKELKYLNQLIIFLREDFCDEHGVRIPIPAGIIPSSTKMLIILSSSEEKIGELKGCILKEGALPDGLETLYIDHYFIRGFQMKMIPTTVKNLMLINYISYEGEADLIPNWIERLFIRNSKEFQDNQYSEDKPLVFSKGCFPSSLKKLHIELIDSSTPYLHIPKSVKDIFIGAKSGPPLYPDILPIGLKVLNGFHNNIENSNFAEEVIKIPTLTPNLGILANLTNLCCDIDFFTIELSLPPTLKVLFLESEIKCIDIGGLAESLEHIRFHKIVSIPILKGALPSSLKNLNFLEGISLETVFPVLPNYLKVLDLGGHSEKNNLEIPFSSLPDSIEIITFQNSFKPQSFNQV